jgi:pyridoxal phosphate enzyme (YggS family)
MHNTVKNLLDIEKNIKIYLNKLNINNNPKIIAVSKTFKLDNILPLIEYGHINFGENKVQETVEKWTVIKKTNSKVKLHMIGKLQTNKVKFAVQIFDYIHSVDSEKLAQKIAEEQNKQNKKLKLFIQVNIGDEKQKSGINVNQIEDLIIFSKKLNLNIIGLMCIPPADEEPDKYFKKIKI